MAVEGYLEVYARDRPGVYQFHLDHLGLFDEARGSTENHQAWTGGLRDHLTQCFLIAEELYRYMFPLYRKARTFSLGSAIVVLYFHDVEKIWKHSSAGLPADFDKWLFYTEYLSDRYKVIFTEEELNALKYIHGEGKDYSTDQRVMNRLAGFCHAIDVLSARVMYDLHWYGDVHEEENRDGRCQGATGTDPVTIGETRSQGSPGQLYSVLDYNILRPSDMGEGRFGQADQ